MRCFFVPINTPRLDFQSPECLLEPKVCDYVSKITAEGLQPIHVRFDGTHHWLQDGFHRVEAAKRMGVLGLHAEITPGSLDEMEADWNLNILPQFKASLAKMP